MGTTKQFGKNGSQRRFIAQQELINGATMKDALLAAGYARSTAETQPQEVIRPIRSGLAAALERLGLTDTQFAKEILEGAKATKPDGSAEWFARLGYHKLIASVRGDEAPKRLQHEHMNTQQVRREQNRLAEALEWLE